jgi:hypothetical protein
MAGIKPKEKLCSFCGKISPLWKSKPAQCHACARKQATTEAIERSKGEHNHKGLTASEDGKEAKVFKVIAPVSKNRQQALAKYRRLRDKYFEEHPMCEFPGCNSHKITLHHKRGRIGAFLTDKRYFCSLCAKHHRWVEENPAEAKRMGLSDSRLENGVMLSKAS